MSLFLYSPTWWERYIGLPYQDMGRTHKGCDCYGLVRLVLWDQCRIEIPSYSGLYTSSEDAPSIARAWDICRNQWRQIDAPEPFSVALYENYLDRLHCGIIIDQRFLLHTTSKKAACRQRLDTMRNYLQGYYIPA